jgi:hypothetical protein
MKRLIETGPHMPVLLSYIGRYFLNVIKIIQTQILTTFIFETKMCFQVIWTKCQ